MEKKKPFYRGHRFKSIWICKAKSYNAENNFRSICLFVESATLLYCSWLGHMLYFHLNAFKCLYNFGIILDQLTCSNRIMIAYILLCLKWPVVYKFRFMVLKLKFNIDLNLNKRIWKDYRLLLRKTLFKKAISLITTMIFRRCWRYPRQDPRRFRSYQIHQLLPAKEADHSTYRRGQKCRQPVQHCCSKRQRWRHWPSDIMGRIWWRF